MNKLFILIFMAMMSLSAQAQNFGGSKNIGLQLQLSQYESEENIPGGVALVKSNSYNISPEFAYFLNNRWKIGGGVSFGQTHGKSSIDVLPGTSLSRSTTVGFRLLAAYHYWLSKKIGFFIEPSLGYRHTTSDTKFQNQTTAEAKSHFFVGGSNVGFLFMISKKFAVDLRINFVRFEYFKNDQSNGTSKSDDNNLSLNFLGGGLEAVLNNFSFGLKYFF